MKLGLSILVLWLFSSCKSTETPKEQENWMLTQRKVFSYSLNELGLPDTSFVTLYKYKNLEVEDSVQAFTVKTYDGSRVINETSYLGSKLSSPQRTTQVHYTYLNDKYITSIVQTTSDVLIKDEKYRYDTSGRLVNSVLIKMRNFDSLSQKAGDKIIPKAELLQQGYDTLNVTYNYDAANKASGANFVDNRGKLIRRDINVYSGNSPLRSFNLGPNDDTIQRISYSQAGNVVQTQSDNDNFTILTATNLGLLTSKLTIYKKESKKIKQDWGYQNGRLTEERFYLDQKNNF